MRRARFPNEPTTMHGRQFRKKTEDIDFSADFSEVKEAFDKLPKNSALYAAGDMARGFARIGKFFMRHWRWFIAWLVVCAAAWTTHVGYSIIHEKWIILIIGFFGFPIGIIHGFLIWLGLV